MEEPGTPKLKSILRHGCAACRVSCDTSQVPDAKPGDEVIARTSRGVEYAVILTAPEEIGIEFGRIVGDPGCGYGPPGGLPELRSVLAAWDGGPAIDATFTIRPHPRSIIPGRNFRVQRNVPVAHTPRTRSQTLWWK